MTVLSQSDMYIENIDPNSPAMMCGLMEGNSKLIFDQASVYSISYQVILWHR